jgi:hypothetical protein
MDRPLSDYWNNRAAKDGLQHKCKDCMRAANQSPEAYARRRAYYAERRQGGADVEVVRRGELFRRYGITLRDYYVMEHEQGGVCAICGAKNRHPRTGAEAVLCVDHDAASGRVRGLLCSACNLGIGNLRHDTARLHAAIAYLDATAETDHRSA